LPTVSSSQSAARQPRNACPIAMVSLFLADGVGLESSPKVTHGERGLLEVSARSP